MLFIKVFTDLPHHRPFRIAIGLYGQMPYMKFLFVRSDICRQLPSDSTSRWTPLPLTMQFPLLGIARDFHPLDNAHAEANKKRPMVGIPTIGLCIATFCCAITC